MSETEKHLWRRQVRKQLGLPGGFGVSVHVCVCLPVCVCVGLVPVSCWAVASLCSISCLSALWAVTGPAGGDLDVEGGGTPALL